MASFSAKAAKCEAMPFTTAQTKSIPIAPTAHLRRVPVTPEFLSNVSETRAEEIIKGQDHERCLWRNSPAAGVIIRLQAVSQRWFPLTSGCDKSLSLAAMRSMV